MSALSVAVVSGPSVSRKPQSLAVEAEGSGDGLWFLRPTVQADADIESINAWHTWLIQ